jgi:hypothetical protein
MALNKQSCSRDDTLISPSGSWFSRDELTEHEIAWGDWQVLFVDTPEWVAHLEAQAS